jgi:hypothetical protein
MWRQKLLLLGSLFLTSCLGLSKNNDFNDMMAGDPPESSKWINPHSMADLDDLQPPSPESHTGIDSEKRYSPKSDISSEKLHSPKSDIDSEKALGVLAILEDIVVGQRTILRAIQSSNLTVDHKESCLFFKS